MIRRIIGRAKQYAIKTVVFVDNKILRGRIKSLYKRIDIKQEAYYKDHPEEYYDKKSLQSRHFDSSGNKIRVIAEKNCAVSDIIMAQYPMGDYSTYKNYDMAVRLMAIEEYQGKNDYGFDIYQRMQAHTNFDWAPRFKNLIASYNEKGFDDSKPIELDCNHLIMDGAHRLALAVANKLEFIPVRIYDCRKDRLADFGRFWEIGYTRDECNMIKKRTEELLFRSVYDYIGVIWPPAYKFADDIIGDLNEIAPERFHIVKTIDLKMDANDFEGFLRAMYHTDILDEAGMKSKTKRIMECTMDVEDGYNVRVFYLHINNPKIGTNVKNYSPQSLEVRRIKEIIRTRYKNKLEKYVYDVIMHISDNYIQSKFCKIVVEINKDISELFDHLKDLKYAVVKSEGRLPLSFPYYYYYYSDVDIVIGLSNMNHAADVVEQWLRKKYEGDWVSIKKIDKDGTVQINVMIRDFRLLCVHFQTVNHFGMKDTFNDHLIEEYVLSSNGVYRITKPSYDVLVRAYEYVNHPKKTWHYDYICMHKDAIDRDLLSIAYFENDENKNKIERLFDEIERGIC